jgi:hypothetical protein
MFHYHAMSDDSLAAIHARIAFALLCVACESKPPSCQDTVANGIKHVEIQAWIDGSNQAAMEALVPFEHSYTGSDVAYLVESCADWTESYRRCIGKISSQLDFITCNQGDETKTAWMAWSALPHVATWLRALSDLAGEAMAAASAAATDARIAADGLGSGSEQLAAAKAKAAAAAALESECQIRPLEKPACLALLPTRSR